MMNYQSYKKQTLITTPNSSQLPVSPLQAQLVIRMYSCSQFQNTLVSAFPFPIHKSVLKQLTNPQDKQPKWNFFCFNNTPETKCHTLRKDRFILAHDWRVPSTMEGIATWAWELVTLYPKSGCRDRYSLFSSLFSFSLWFLPAECWQPHQGGSSVLS